MYNFPLTRHCLCIYCTFKYWRSNFEQKLIIICTQNKTDPILSMFFKQFQAKWIRANYLFTQRKKFQMKPTESFSAIIYMTLLTLEASLSKQRSHDKALVHMTLSDLETTPKQRSYNTSYWQLKANIYWTKTVTGTWATNISLVT